MSAINIAFIPLLPLASFLLLGLFGKKHFAKSGGIIGTLSLAGSALLSLWTAFNYFFVSGKVDGVYQKLEVLKINWLEFAPGVSIDIGLLLDPISVMMLVVVTFISLMVHVYSLGYMKGEERFSIYYSFLSLFTFSMLEAKAISQHQYDSISKAKIALNFHNPDYREGVGTYIREYIRQELKNWCDKNKKPDGSKWDVYEDGLKVYTTIDSRMQKYAEAAVAEHLTGLQDVYFKEWKGKDPWKFGSRAKPDLLNKMMRQSDRYLGLKAEGKSDAEIKKIFETKIKMEVFSWHGDKTQSLDTVMSPLDSLRYYLQIIQVGFLAVDAKSGEVKAWIGGPNIRYFQLDHVKTTTKRQVGSTMKPFLYALALERNYEPCTLIPYLAPDCPGIDANWNPDGTDKWEEGEMVPMKDGLAASDNRITSRIMCDIGDPQALVQFAHQCEIESKLDAVPSLCLGTCDISLFEMVGAYTCFANLGTYSKPYFIKRIEDKDGNVLAQFGETHKEAIPEKTAYTLTEMLKGVINRGTAASLRPHYGLQMPLAGKTGTTQGNSDAWFMCYNPDIVVGAWVGFEQPSVHFASNRSGAGATAAMPIVGAFLRKSFNDRAVQLKHNEFSPPADSSSINNLNWTCIAVMDTAKKKQEPMPSGTGF